MGRLLDLLATVALATGLTNPLHSEDIVCEDIFFVTTYSDGSQTWDYLWTECNGVRYELEVRDVEDKSGGGGGGGGGGVDGDGDGDYVWGIPFFYGIHSASGFTQQDLLPLGRIATDSPGVTLKFSQMVQSTWNVSFTIAAQFKLLSAAAQIGYESSLSLSTDFNFTTPIAGYWVVEAYNEWHSDYYDIFLRPARHKPDGSSDSLVFNNVRADKHDKVYCKITRNGVKWEGI